MTAIVLWLAETTIAVAVLATIVGILCRMFKRQPALQHALWLVVLLKMLTPSVVAWPWSLDTLHTSVEHLTARPEPRLPQAAERPVVVDRTTDAPTMASTDVAQISVSTPLQSAPNLGDEPRAGNGTSVAAVEVVFFIWSIGCLVAAGVQVKRIGRRWRLVRQGRPAPGELAGAVEAVARQMGARSVPVVVVEGVAAPFVWCLGRARLCWPAALADATEIDRARAIIAHELAHVRRWDHHVAWLELVANVLWWFSPLFWLARARLRAASEMACDAIALGAASSDRRGYAELLLAFSTDARSNPAAAIGIFAGSRKSFERRLQMILSERVSNKVTVAGLLLVALVAAIAIPGWPIAAAADDQSPKRPKPTPVSVANTSAVSLSETADDEKPAAPGSGAKKGDEPAQAKPVAVDKELLQYDGKSFEWWRDYLRTELKGERRIEGIDAMSAFGVSGRPVEAAEVIVEVLQSNRSGYQGEEKVQSAASMALKHIGPAASPAVLPALQATDSDVRRVVLWTLADYLEKGMVDKTDVVRALLPMTENADVMGRVLAVRALTHELEALPIIVRLLREDPDRNVREAALGALGESGATVDTVVPHLIEATRDSDDNVRSSAWRLLVASKADPQAVVIPRLIAALEGGDKRDRTTAIHHLAGYRSLAKPAVPALIKAYSKVDPNYRGDVVWTLGQIGPDAKQAIPLLTKALKDQDEHLQKTAHRALQQITESGEE